ncbi:DNA polymerase III subunit beta [Paenibacillus sp. J31TS4]|uniref:DNA polymerase III subunit beta n=1 Tax=Paenibacillus sp. J31TS4 TaxID=2807195 RepID=UPI001B141625|nr:DNA polymerase III subunit beta [Paenibacillus sp. J31TS4]GIP40649.1 DNA polymerase III subunit beta [Paenibacillus sp. J31TS4]
MKFSVSKDKLNESIQQVSKAISSRTTIPILSGIKIDASPRGLTLTASDTDISIQSFIPAEEGDRQNVRLAQAGSVVLPAKFFIEMVRKLPSDFIEMERGTNFHTTIRAGASDIQMVGLDPDEYPLLPQIEDNKVISMASDLLRAMIRQTSFAVSTSETTPILTGVCWNLSNNNLKLIGCDRHRLATRETSMETQSEQQFHNIVISGKTLNELSKILPDHNQLIDIVVSENQVLFRMENVLFYSRILDGAYPETSKLIPKEFNTEVVVPVKALIEAIDRAYLLSREDKTNIVKMVMNPDKTMEISSSSTELGRVTETLDMNEHTGELLKISFNSKYMLDALKVIDCDRARIGFTGSMSPIIIQPEDGTKILQLILPYRTTN